MGNRRQFDRDEAISVGTWLLKKGFVAGDEEDALSDAVTTLTRTATRKARHIGFITTCAYQPCVKAGPRGRLIRKLRDQKNREEGTLLHRKSLQLSAGTYQRLDAFRRRNDYDTFDAAIRGLIARAAKRPRQEK